MAPDGTVVAAVTTDAGPAPVQDHLRISEIMYHPADPAAAGPWEGDDFEFIELLNTSATAALYLKDVALTGGVQYTFPALWLDPGAHAVVVRDVVAFAERYGTGPLVVGRYGGPPADSWLSNSGETLRLVDADGVVIQQFDYDDRWYGSTDGGGYSLEMVDPRSGDLALWGTPQGWAPSGLVGGTPGVARATAAVATGRRDLATAPARRLDSVLAADDLNPLAEREPLRVAKATARRGHRRGDRASPQRVLVAAGRPDVCPNGQLATFPRVMGRVDHERNAPALRRRASYFAASLRTSNVKSTHASSHAAAVCLLY